MLISSNGFTKITTDTGTWSIEWTGWKSSPQHPYFAGQWLAVPVDENGAIDDSRLAYYSSCPGIAHFFHRGEWFNLSRQEDQDHITSHTPEDVKVRERDRALGKLMTLIGVGEVVTCY